jgi:hypothetical protein
MLVVFALMILVGSILAWSSNDDVWYEDLFSGQRYVGVVMVASGIVGVLYVWMRP